MKIESVLCDHYRIPLPTVLSDSTHGEMSHFELVTARVHTDSGHEGLGYTYTVGAGGAAIRALIVHDLAPLLVGADPEPIESLWQHMWQHLHFVGRGGLASFAIAAIDIALWDLAARRAARPLWRLLGGHDPWVKAYAGGVDLHLSPEELCTQVSGFLDQGFRAIKIKVGRPTLAEDVARVAAVRDLLGPDVPLMVDANMQWTVDEAIQAARELAAFNPFWLEEPTIPEDYEGHAHIADEGGLALAAGENLHTIHEFRRMMTTGGVAYPEPDLATLGGVTVWMEVARLAQKHGLAITSHGVHDLHVHVLSAAPNASYLEVHAFGLEPYMHHALCMEDGRAIAPSRPGHGVELDWDALEVHRI